MNERTPDLPMDFDPVFDLDVQRADDWPMPPIKPWAPVHAAPVRVMVPHVEPNPFMRVIFGIFQ